MESKGIVQEINGNKIIVLPYKSEGCGGCDKCHGAEKYGCPVEFTIDFPINIGDEVTFSVEDTEMLKTGAILYLVPIAAFFIGYFIASLISSDEKIKIAGSFGLMALCFVLLSIYDKYIGKKSKNKIIIKKSQN